MNHLFEECNASPSDSTVPWQTQMTAHLQERRGALQRVISEPFFSIRLALVAFPGGFPTGKALREI